MKTNYTPKGKVYPLLLAGLAVGVASGCASINESYVKAGDNSDALKADMEHNLSFNKSAVKERTSIWLGGESYRIAEASLAPGILSREVSFRQMDPISVSDLITILSVELGIKIVLTEDAFEYVQDSEAEDDDDDDIELGDIGLASLTFSNSKKIPGSDIAFTLDYKGPLAGLLDSITGKLGLFWRYERGEIVIKRSETRTYTVDLPSGKASYSASMSSDLATVEGSGSSSHSSGFMFSPEDNWENFSATLETMLSKTGSIKYSEVQGLVTITDTPQVHTRAEDYIKTINDVANRQVAIQVSVYEVSSDHTGEFDASIMALYNWKDDLNIGVQGNSWQIGVAGAGITENKFQEDANAAINLLNTHKNSSLVTSGAIYAMNGHPTPFQQMNEITYIAERSVTTNEGATESTIVPGMTGEGISMMLMPRILSDGRVMMNFAIDTSSIIAMTKEGPIDEQITMPSRSTNRYQQVVTVKSGSPLMIAGMERTSHDADIKSPFGKQAWFLGGSKAGGKTRTMTMIVLTPFIMQK